jgi:hypothetical protein
MTPKPEGRPIVEADYWSKFRMPCGAEVDVPISDVLGIRYLNLYKQRAACDITKLRRYIESAPDERTKAQRRNGWMNEQGAVYDVLLKDYRHVVQHFKGRGFLFSPRKVADMDSPPYGITPHQITHIEQCPACQAALDRRTSGAKANVYWEDVAAAQEAARVEIQQDFAAREERALRQEATERRRGLSEEVIGQNKQWRMNRAVRIRDRELAQLERKIAFVNNRRQRA